MAAGSTPPPEIPGRRVLLVVVITLSAALVLSVVLLSGSNPGSSGASSGNPFSAARALADKAVPSSGAWNLIESVGIAPSNATVLPVNETSTSNCSVTPLVGSVPGNYTIPTFQGNLLSGDASAWLLAYVQPSTGTALVVLETGGSVSLALELSAGCTNGTLAGFRAIPSDVIDSTAAVSAAAHTGGAAFLQAHPTGVYLEMSLLGSDVLTNLTSLNWAVVLTTCAPFAVVPTSSGEMFSALVNATTGQVVPGSATNGTCGYLPPTPDTLGAALTPGIPTVFQGTGTLAGKGCTQGDYCASFPLLSTAENVTPADFTMSVMSRNNTLYPTVGYSILSATGQVVVYSVGTVESQWSPAVGSSTTLLTSGMQIVVDFGTQLPTPNQYVLELNGQGPFADSAIGIFLDLTPPA